MEGNSSTESRESTPLHDAVERGDFVSVAILLRRGANVEAKNEDQRTALGLALDRKDRKNAKILIKAGADVNSRSKSGETALHFAARYNNSDVIEYLLGRGANANVRSSNDWTTPLHCVLLANVNETLALKSAELLFSKGEADIEAKTKQGNTPLHLASMLGQSRLVEWLLDRGANARAKNDKGETPLLIAIKHDKAKVIQTLASRGIDVNEGSRSQTALHLACHRANPEVVRCLLENGADPNALNSRGLPPLIHLSDEPACVDLLLSHGANVNFATPGGESAVLQELMASRATALVLSKHAAKLRALGLPVRSDVLEALQGEEEYWKKCDEELTRARDTEVAVPGSSRVTFLDLLADCAERPELENAEEVDFEKLFPIYGESMRKTVSRAKKTS